MGVKIQLFEVGLSPLDFCLWGWIKSEVYTEKVSTRDEFVASIMNNAALVKQERKDHQAEQKNILFCPHNALMYFVWVAE